MSNRVKLEALLALINSAAQQTMALYENVDATVPSIDSAEFHPLDEALDQVELKAAIRTLEGACAQLCTTLAPPGHTAMNVRRLFSPDSRKRPRISWRTIPRHVNELSKNIDVEPKKLSRIMRMLATRDCYSEVSKAVYANTRLALALHSENSVSHMVNLHTESASKGAALIYGNLKEPRTAYSYHPGHCPVMVANNKEGITEAFFNWMRQKDSTRESYHRSVQGLAVIMSSSAVLTQFPFNKYSTVVDVGGGIDAFSLPLAKVHKHVKITVHDLPDALIQARSVWAKDCPEAIQENRVEFSELDFFTQVPVAGRDIYYLRNRWAPTAVSSFVSTSDFHVGFTNLRRSSEDYVVRQVDREQAALEESKFGITMAPEPMLPNFGVGNIRMYEQDMIMFIMHNARERTLSELLELSDAAGLKLEKIWDLSETPILEYTAA
ncbi:S-adenosyl-L-methionine-dependent methyltransferase [Pisolithus thermaeus]|nr:S-adenosyl-L-methionine-dependent methyltransferase [Pisolithus thermaeus]